jgi:hypothetical protein
MNNTTLYDYIESDNLDLRASSERLKRTALHESAHAICCASQLFSDRRDNGIQVPGGVFLTIVSVVPTSETWGHYNLWPKTDSQITLNAIDLAGGTVTYLSTGSMKQILYEARGDCEFLADRMGISEGDILHAFGYLLVGESPRDYEGLEWFETLRKSFNLCRTIIENRMPEILALADHLLDVRKMNSKQIADYLEMHQIHAQEWRTNETD